MNRRQTEKHFKRKWKEALCGLFYNKQGLKVKPSRLKLHIAETEDSYCFVGGFSGYTFKIEGTKCKDK
jgi:hypothetical protein